MGGRAEGGEAASGAACGSSSDPLLHTQNHES